MFLGGYLLFLLIILMAFWLLIFLTGFALPYALTQWVMYKFRGGDAEEETPQVQSE